MNETAQLDEITVADILKLAIAYWRTIAVTVITSVVIAAVAYVLVPRTYRLIISIQPARQVDLARFTALTNAGIFPYDRIGLFKEYVNYVEDYDLLSEAVEENFAKYSISENGSDLEGVVRRQIEFTVNPKEPEVLIMTVSGQGVQYTYDLADSILKQAEAVFSKQILVEINQKIDANTEDLQFKKSVLEDEIDARRTTQAKISNDQLTKFAEQAEIAHIVGIDKPFHIATTSADGNGTGTTLSVDIPSSSLEPTYLAGYQALEEAIKQLKLRKDNDAYIPSLRDLQRQVLQLESDNSSERIKRLVLQSGLGGVDSPRLVFFQQRANQIRKVFPNALAFGGAGLFVGLFLGLVLAFAKSRRLEVKPETSA